MRFSKKTQTVFKLGILAIAVFIVSFLVYQNNQPLEIKAGSEHNIKGFAWSENLGWISFNSLNCDSNDDGKSDGTSAGCPPVGTSMGLYGVNVDTSGTDPEKPVSANSYAWSEYVGWIRFDAPKDGQGKDLWKDNYPGNPKQGVTVNISTGEVKGWARACGAASDPATCTGGVNPAAGGWDGWIKMKNGPGEPKNYAATFNKTTKEFEGFAWGSNVVGWVSFNRKNCDPDQDGDSDGSPAGCPGTIATPVPVGNYKVDGSGINLPPSVTTAGESWDYCATGTVFLKWVFSDPDGDKQGAYNVQLDTNSGFSSPDIDDSGTGETEQHPISFSRLVWKTKYFWRVRVKDDRGSDWSEWSNTDDFTMPDHPYPDVDFISEPERLSAEEDIKFTDTSQCYTLQPPNTPVAWNCGSGGTSDTTFEWWFNPDGNPSHYEASTGNKSVITQFPVKGDKTAKLKVVDQSNYSCELEKTLLVRPPLPEWKEVSPH